MTDAPLERLRAGAESLLGRPLPDNAPRQFSKYLELLIKWQKLHRLVGSSDPTWIIENLFLDSLLFFRVLPPLGSLVDIGSGAGFPGYPLKIVRPDLAITLIERRQTRVSFLKAVSRALGLAGVEIVSEPAERVAGVMRGRFDAAVMRCAGRNQRLVPLAAQFVRSGGVVVASSTPGVAPAIGNRVDVPGVAPGTTRSFIVSLSL